MTVEQIAAMQLELKTEKEKNAKYEQAKKEQEERQAFESITSELNLSSTAKDLLETSGLKDPEAIKAFVEKNKDKSLLFEVKAPATNTGTFVPPAQGIVNPAPRVEGQEEKKGISKQDVNSEDYFSSGFSSIKAQTR